jgi:glycosyltransferase involved in cell wall biosynthesis
MPRGKRVRSKTPTADYDAGCRQIDIDKVSWASRPLFRQSSKGLARRANPLCIALLHLAPESRARQRRGNVLDLPRPRQVSLIKKSNLLSGVFAEADICGSKLTVVAPVMNVERDLSVSRPRVEGFAAGRAREKQLSLVVPCFNEIETIAELVRRVTAVASSTFGDYELILVDDGSHDGTWEKIAAFAETHPQIIGVKLSRNHGHQIALTAGLSVVRGRYVFVIDADLQDPPEHLPAMYGLMLREEADVVYGKRRSRSGESPLKKNTASLFYRLLAATTDIDIPIDAGDFRLMSRRVADLLVQMPERDRFLRGMVAWLGFKQVPFEYDRDARFAGETKYPFKRMVRFAIDAFLGHSMLLLRVAAAISFGLFASLVVVFFYAVYCWVTLNVVPGWTSITMLIILTSATQLMVLSIMGEYLGRAYLEGKRRPLFIVDQIVGNRSDDHTEQLNQFRSTKETT